MNGIDCSIKSGLPVSIITHVNQQNMRELQEFRDFLSVAGVTSWQVQLGVSSGVMCEYSENVIDPDELLWLVPQIAGMKGDETVSPRIDVGDNIGYFGKYESDLRRLDDTGTSYFWRGCNAGLYVVGIESDGSIKGCLSLPSSQHEVDLFVEGSVQGERLTEIWHRKTAFARNRCFHSTHLRGFCAECPHRDICRAGCFWTAFSHSGNEFEQTHCFYRQARLHGRDDLADDDGYSERVRQQLIASG
jgi:radical SAM protein with 4Fe4S-binding SPASM domain